MSTLRGLTHALVATVVVACLTTAGADDAVRLPVSIDVSAAHAYLRCGPSDDFYPTERLVAGDAVEVWAIDASGYCAVRPVAGSYSWMLARDVQRESTGPGPDAAPSNGPQTGVVITDAAIGRVGSQINELRHVTQVALEAGERVVILDAVRVAEGRHAGDWLKIAPPSGEFRWVRCGRRAGGRLGGCRRGLRCDP